MSKLRRVSKWETLFSFQVKAAGLPEPQTEYRFHQTRKWRADFAWPDKKLLVELEGGTRSGGRHVRGTGYEKDCEKYNAAALLGYTVLRFTGAMVKRGEALRDVEKALDQA